MKRLFLILGAFFLFYLLSVVLLNTFGAPKEQSQEIAQQDAQASPSGRVQSEILTEGTGQTAATGDSVTVHYLGTLEDGTKFESSYDSDVPYTFTLGQGEVIKGWDEGVVGMKIGEKRRLTIPSDLAYGATGQGSIPPNTTLIFEVELLGIAASTPNTTIPQLNL